MKRKTVAVLEASFYLSLCALAFAYILFPAARGFSRAVFGV